MAKIIEQLSLMDVAPPSITGDKNVKHLITAIDPELLNVSQDIREAFIISRLNELPEEVLDLLAWQWHVDFYDIAHTLEAKRAMVLKSISWHRKKGTRGAILEALEMLGVEAKFTSWQDLQDEGAQPYTFVIDAKLTRDFWERVDWTKPTQTIRRAIEESKAARSWMSRLYVYMEAQAEHNITIGTSTFLGAHHVLAFVPKTHSEASQLITIGTGTFQTTHHDIAIVQGTQSATGLDIAVGAGIIQSGHHNIDMVQGTSSASELDISIGTGTFQTWTHEVKHIQATKAEADSVIAVGASVIQGAKHEVDIQQCTSGSAELDISVGIVAAQKISHDVKIQQATRGSTEGDISVGAGVIAGSVHSVSLNQPTLGQAQACVPVGIGILQSAAHTISIGISTIAKSELFTGTALKHDISHSVGLKPSSTLAHGEVVIGAGITQGKQQGIALRQAKSGSASLALPFALVLSNQVVHSISAGMSTLSRAELFAGTATMQTVSHNVGMKKAEGSSTCSLSAGCAIACGIHMQIKMAA